ncbi:MAG: hypothetical protein QXF61_02985 [Nitrososphaeria archaeon]
MEKENNITFQLWQLERQLLAVKLSLFLLTSSILFLGYVQVRATWLGIVISAAGIFSCMIGALNFKRIPNRLKKLEEQINIKWDNGLKARHIAILFPPFFGTIWFFSLIFSILSLLT